MKTLTRSCILVLAVLAPLSSYAGQTPVAPGAVHISLSRGGCRGDCPVYSVDIDGDGSMLYVGVQHVDALGEERYVLPPEEVSKLVLSAMSKNLMSLKGSYRWGATRIWPPTQCD
jgi:hypothetical protein